MKPTEGSGTLLVETNRFDVFLGRGKNANNRPGNMSFRKLVLELFEAYQNTDCGEEKNQLAMKLVSQIQDMGGRFIRPVAAVNSSGQQVSAWEVVADCVAVTKVKQAIRDVAIGKKKKKKAKKEHLEQQVASNGKCHLESSIGLMSNPPALTSTKLQSFLRMPIRTTAHCHKLPSFICCRIKA